MHGLRATLVETEFLPSTPACATVWQVDQKREQICKVIEFLDGRGDPDILRAFVAEQWGRRWITTDTSRVALSLARARIMGAKFPFYRLADSSPTRQSARR